MSATASVGDGLARRDRGFAQGTTRNVSRQAVSISIGVAVGLALVLLCLTGAFLSHAVGPTAGPPPFAFQIVVNGSATVPGGFQYNLTLAWIEHGLPALGWIQFYVLTGNLTVVVPFTVNVTTLAGSAVGHFDSANSTWHGASTRMNGTLQSFGGWSAGSASQLQPTDTFEVFSNQTLTGYDLVVAMQLTGPPSPMGTSFVGM